MPSHANKCRDSETSLFDTDQQRAFEMIDVGDKAITKRRALASGSLHMGPKAFELLSTRNLPKGDALILAEVAGIQATKNASNTIPLCHPLPIDKTTITLTLNKSNNSVTATCVCSAYAKTGVEMEALAGVNGALLALYDLIKGVDAALTISNVHLEVKEGGKSGLWIHPDEQEKWKHLTPPSPLKGIKTAVITLSDRASKGEYEDLSGPAGVEILTSLGAIIEETIVIPDEQKQLASKLKRLSESGNIDFIVTTGGTGFSERDVTPEAINSVCKKTIPGFGELLRQDGSKHTKFAYMSRSTAGICENTLIVGLPGNPKAVKEGVQALQSILPHTIHIIQK